jgi:hypothetical protein
MRKIDGTLLVFHFPFQWFLVIEPSYPSPITLTSGHFHSIPPPLCIPQCLINHSECGHKWLFVTITLSVIVSWFSGNHAAIYSDWSPGDGLTFRTTSPSYCCSQISSVLTQQWIQFMDFLHSLILTRFTIILTFSSAADRQLTFEF